MDGREFGPGRLTGIGRVVEGLVDALLESPISSEILLAVLDARSTPMKLKNRQRLKGLELPHSFLGAEGRISNLTKHGVDLFISPYPKLPFFGVHCRAVHIIHDVLDITHPLYRRRLKALFDRYRLKEALHRADITWYDSSWSMAETQKHFGQCGRNPKVRHPGIHDVFRPEKQDEDSRTLEAYGLKAGYVLAIGNGLPHKNLGTMLHLAPKIQRPVVFAGVSDRQQLYWKSQHRGIRAQWIRHLEEQHLPAVLRGAFCLVQPSLIEGYGYPPLEAMACGIPAIVSRIPVLLEATGNCALSASPHDPAEWKDTLQRLEDASCYDDFVRKGLKWSEALRGRRAWEPYLEDVKNLMKGI